MSKKKIKQKAQIIRDSIPCETCENLDKNTVKVVYPCSACLDPESKINGYRRKL